jgi:hypothetical protein
MVAFTAFAAVFIDLDSFDHALCYFGPLLSRFINEQWVKIGLK